MPTDIQTQPLRNTQLIYDPAAGTPIVGVDNNTSMVARVPAVIQVEAIPAGTTAVLKARVNPSAAWVTITSPVLDSTNTPALVNLYNAPYNFVEVVRTGVGSFKVYSQK